MSHHNSEFTRRHIGPSISEQTQMLKELGFSSLDDLADKVVPASIRSSHQMKIVGDGVSEYDLLEHLKTMMSENKLFKSLIGLGYHGTITPSVIQRNILENPVWYTAYTPYQAEISQGRLEALLNFQTMVSDLTGLPMSNASLLDEGTAAAEAMAMAHAIGGAKAPTAFVASPKLHPQTLEILKTRAEPLGLKVLVQDPAAYNYSEPVFAVFVQYPDTEGALQNWRATAEKAHANKALVVAATDLLALTLIEAPGEWGADIAIGTSQRFGVPLGFGGPHAAFLSTKDEYKRLIPGRLVGVAVDNAGAPALRLALQTREQHIRREKATSNICTAQVLLANMASMYAVYHGPNGLKHIAGRVHNMARVLAEGLNKLNFKVRHAHYFDTLTIEVPNAQNILNAAVQQQINLRALGNAAVGISLDETCNAKTVEKIWQAFNKGQAPSFSFAELEKSTAATHPLVSFLRKSHYLTHPVFNSYHSETEMLRYIHRLQNKDFTLTHSMIPLGSCTMKLNATTELMPVSWPEIGQLHPYAPLDQAKGYMAMIQDLENKICDLTGFAAVSLQPNAGSQGEYAGLLAIREYYKSKNQAHRNVVLIPSSAHGTNPASAVMAGFKVIVVQCRDNGDVDLQDLQKKAVEHKNDLAALMVTYPSTHGVFEEGIREICNIVHECGGQVYMDGANMNAQVGLCRPGEFGPDVSHLNLHKTFSIPHGGGGPGIGPIGVRAHLKEFLPRVKLDAQGGPHGPMVSAAPWGSASILPISWAYITMMGGEGLKQASLVSILNANYIAKKLAGDYQVLYKGKNGLVAHECILDLRDLKKIGLDVADIAKRLMDYGFHAPTMSFPVPGTLMVEPTESESKKELDRFIEAMHAIKKEMSQVEKKTWPADNNPLVNAPHTSKACLNDSWAHPYSRELAAFPAAWVKENKIWPAVGRIDNAYGDRNIFCTCVPVEGFATS